MSLLLKELRITLALAAPIIVGQVSQMLIGITDSAMIGRVGAAPLAAAAFTNGIFGVVYVVGVGLLFGVGVFAARDHGAGDEAGCAAWLRHGRALALAISILIFLLLAALTTQAHRFGQPAEVVAIVRPYMLLISASMIPALFFFAQRQFAESQGKPWVPMVILLVDVVLNALLNWMFVFGKLGLPALGLIGSGWATLIARVAAVVALAWWLERSPDFAVLRAADTGRWETARFRTLLQMGVPAGGMLLFEAGAFSAAALMMGWIGTIPLAAHQVALSCAALTFMVPLGLSTAVSLRISKVMGENRPEAVRPIGFGAIGAGVLLMAAFALAFVLAGRLITGGFTTDEAVAALAARLLVVAAVFQIFDGSQVIGAACLRGLADVKVPTVITFIAYWVLALPIAAWLAFRTPMGPVGVWAGLAAGLACAAVLLGARFLHKTRGLATEPARG